MLIDWLVIAAYLLVIAAVGLFAARRVTSSSSFFISDRSFGKLMMTFFSFGTGTNTDQAVSVASKTYSVGASGIWYQWLWLFSTPFYWLLAPLFRRMRAVTTADYLFARYGQSVAVLFALVGMLQLAVNIGVVLKASSAMITAVSGGAIDPTFAIFAMTLLFVGYGVFGGLGAAILTDLIQGILTIVLSFLILPFALAAVGGMSGLRASVSDPGLFSIVAPGEITALYVVVIALNGLVGWVTSPYSMAMCGAGRSEYDARFGLVAGHFLKRLCTIAWVLTGLVGIALYANAAHPDQVYGLLARDFLPAVAPGLLGLFIASMLAAVMSSCDAFMVTSAALFTENIYKPLIRPGLADRHYVLVGRIASVAVVGGGILIAFGLTSVIDGLELFWIVQAMMGVAIWVSFFWRRASAAAAWASTLSGFAVWLLTSDLPFLGWHFNANFAHLLPGFMLHDGAISLPWQMIAYLAASLTAMIAVSLLTQAPPKERLDEIYETLRTPVLPGEPETAPLKLPPNVRPAPRSVLIEHPDFELMKPTSTSVVGFLASWAVVGALIWLFIWMLGI